MCKFGWKNASSEDLLTVMDQVSGKNVSGFLKPWIELKCFPEILIERIKKDTFRITQ